MKSFKYLFLLVIALTIAILSCSKKDEAINSKSQSELLTSHPWKISSQKLNGATVVALADCEKDDYYSYSANGIWTVNPGLVLCYSNEKVRSGSYSLSYDMKTIIEPVLGSPDDKYTITELTANKLVLSFTAAEGAWEITHVPY